MVEKKHYCDRKLEIWATGTPLKSPKWTHVLRRGKQFPRLNIIFGITSENSYSTIDSIVSSMNCGSLWYFFRQCLYNAMRVVLTWGLVTKISLLSYFSISERIGLEVLSRGFSISFLVWYPWPLGFFCLISGSGNGWIHVFNGGRHSVQIFPSQQWKWCTALNEGVS
jgi:hypothetical protein